MSYNIKLSDYSLLPKRAIPLDARSHFSNFAQANKAILGNVATVETADEIDNDYKQFYVGQIITTTTGNTWKVNSPTTFTVTLYIDYVNKQVKWGSENDSDIIGSFTVKQVKVNTNLYAVFDGNDKVTEDFVGQQSSVKLDTCLVPFSGSGGGGSATLKLDGIAPINVDNSNRISLSLDTNSALIVNNENQLTLSLDTNALKVDNSSGTAKLTLNIESNAPFTTTNGLSLAIDNKGGLKQNSNNELYVEGTHKTIIKNDTVDDIKVNNYIYQEI